MWLWVGEVPAGAWKEVGPGQYVHLCAPLEVCSWAGGREGEQEGKPRSPPHLPSSQAGLDEIPGAGSGELSGGPGGRSGVPKTPKPPYCLPDMT